MEIEMGGKKYIETGKSTYYRYFASAREEADMLEELFDLSCFVERSGKSFKIFCRGAVYHKIKEAR